VSREEAIYVNGRGRWWAEKKGAPKVEGGQAFEKRLDVKKEK